MTQLTVPPAPITPADPPSSPVPATSPTAAPRVSRAARWAGWIVGAIPSFFLLMAAGMNFARPDFVVEGTKQMGYPERVLTPLGIVVLISTLLYLFPRTAVLGAILLTGYFGGAVATHVRVSDPFLTVTLFPAFLGVLLWLGLYLRDRRVRALVPLRQPAA